MISPILGSLLFLAQVPLSAAFPKYQLTYYPPIENCNVDTECCSGATSNPILYSWIWDLEDECFAFIPFNVDNVYDSINNPVYTDTSIEYSYHPYVDDCSATSETKKYATTDGCTYQYEGMNYYLKITCIQKTSSDPECEELYTENRYPPPPSSPSAEPPAADQDSDSASASASDLDSDSDSDSDKSEEAGA
ncbi:hypothetical protein CYMTET_31249 [Cymbomonas tetramitiformis]|uniref:Uncharacterized protein n=1 Tax=Cymbomonas tetramitiformis TaxID=36881 RepID=A0AAE0FHL5_9CHLO|nr:hypothetical protein CYMTET_31249 [Cymbomonas tetramitiformis]